MNDDQPITYSALGPGAGDAIVRLHRRAFSSEELQYTIFASPRIEALIEDLLKDDQQLFIGAVHGRDLVGYAQIRRLESGPHLNNIAVDPELQGQGVGDELLSRVVDRAIGLGGGQLTLHVNNEHPRTKDWYGERGFKAVSESLLLVAKPVGADPVGEIRTSMTSEQRKRLENSGISQMSVIVGGKVYDVGIIGARIYRIGKRYDQQLVDALHSLEPGRQIIVTATSVTDLRCEATVVQRNVRMMRAL